MGALFLSAYGLTRMALHNSAAAGPSNPPQPSRETPGKARRRPRAIDAMAAAVR